MVTRALPRTDNGVSLSAVRTGESARIRALEGGQCFLSRLASLGFTPGAVIRVVQNYGRGPIIVNLRDSKVALGRGEANKIVVDKVMAGQDGL